MTISVLGGAGFVGRHVARRLAEQGSKLTVVDRRLNADSDRRHPVDLLVERCELAPGPVVLCLGSSDPRAPHPWRVVFDNVFPLVRVAPQLGGRSIVAVSSVEVYGQAPGPLTESSTPTLPLPDERLADWVRRARHLADAGPVEWWRAADLCSELADSDPSGRWVYGMAKRCMELVIEEACPSEPVTTFRVANLFGAHQDRVVVRLARRALAGLPLRVPDTVRTFLDVDDLATAILSAIETPGRRTVNAGGLALRLTAVARLILDELGLVAPVESIEAARDDGAGVVSVVEFSSRWAPGADSRTEAALRAVVRNVSRDFPGQPLDRVAVVVPPRPERPAVVVARQQRALWTGELKTGGPCTTQLEKALAERLRLGPESRLLVTSSGTAALRLAIFAAAGLGAGRTAVLPAFTFAATAEAAIQLGYRLAFCDVDPVTWTMDADCLSSVLRQPDIGVVICVDALGAPADYEALRAGCRERGIPLVADSAAALGALSQGQPVGTQTSAHAFSMSFAKVVSAAGGGGAVVLPTAWLERIRHPVDWYRSSGMGEVHAAAALDLVERLDHLMARRAEVASVYAEMTAASEVLSAQRVGEGDTHSWVHWTARVIDGSRERLARGLEEHLIATKPYYAPVLDEWPWGVDVAQPCELPVSRRLARETLAFPMSSELTPADAERVATTTLALIRR